MQSSTTLNGVTGEAGRLCLLLSTFFFIEVSEKIMPFYCSLASRNQARQFSPWIPLCSGQIAQTPPVKLISCMQQPNISLMKTPQNSRRKRCQLQAHTLTTSEIQKLVPIYFFVKFSQAAKSNTKTCGSTSLQDSLVVFAIIFEHLL